MKNSILLYAELVNLWLQIHHYDRKRIFSSAKLPRAKPRFFWTIYTLHFFTIGGLLLYFIPAHPMKIPTVLGTAATWTTYALLDYVLASKREKATAR